MDEIDQAVNDYFEQHPIDIEAIKNRYRDKYQCKILDDSTQEPYKLGVENAKFYIITQS